MGEDHPKFFCKGQDPADCLREGIKVASQYKGLGQFTLKEQSHVTTVTITDMKAEDSGIYWCGVHKGEFFFTSAVLLSVHNSKYKLVFLLKVFFPYV